MAWTIINISASLVACTVIVYLLTAYGHRFNLLENMGMGLSGGALLMTVGPILVKGLVVDASPFDDWSGTLLRVGCAIGYLGIVARLEGFAPASRLAPPPGEGRKFRRRIKSPGE